MIDAKMRQVGNYARTELDDIMQPIFDEQNAKELTKFGTLAKTKQWFVEAVPHPTKDNQRVQVGCHLEEVLEMLDTISISGKELELTSLKQSLEYISNILKKNADAAVTINDRTAFLDAIADQLVTGTGCGHVFGMNVLGALDEVNLSNWSKFENNHAVFNENGKIKKGINYKEPNLAPFIGTDPVQR